LRRHLGEDSVASLVVTRQDLVLVLGVFLPWDFILGQDRFQG
jgi:hypothetical protein